MSDIRTLALGFGGAGGRVLNYVSGECMRTWRAHGEQYFAGKNAQLTRVAFDTNLAALNMLQHVQQRIPVAQSVSRGLGAGDWEVANLALQEALPQLEDLIKQHHVVYVFGSRAKHTGATFLNPVCELADAMKRLVVRCEIMPSIQGYEVTSERHELAVSHHRELFQKLPFHCHLLLNDAIFQTRGKTKQLWNGLNTGIGPGMAHLLSLFSELNTAEVDPNDVFRTMYAGPGYLATYDAVFRVRAEAKEISNLLDEAIETWLCRRVCEFDPSRLRGVTAIIHGDTDNYQEQVIRSKILHFARRFRRLSEDLDGAQSPATEFNPQFLCQPLPAEEGCPDIHVTVLLSEAPRAPFDMPEIDWPQIEAEGSMDLTAIEVRSAESMILPALEVSAPLKLLSGAGSARSSGLKKTERPGKFTVVFETFGELLQHAFPLEKREEYGIKVPLNLTAHREAVYWMFDASWTDNEWQTPVSDGKGGHAPALKFRQGDLNLLCQEVSQWAYLLPLLKDTERREFSITCATWCLAQESASLEMRKVKFPRYWVSWYGNTIRRRSEIPRGLTRKTLERKKEFLTLKSGKRIKLIREMVDFECAFGYAILEDYNLFEEQDDRALFHHAVEGVSRLPSRAKGLIRVPRIPFPVRSPRPLTIGSASGSLEPPAASASPAGNDMVSGRSEQAENPGAEQKVNGLPGVSVEAIPPFEQFPSQAAGAASSGD